MIREENGSTFENDIPLDVIDEPASPKPGIEEINNTAVIMDNIIAESGSDSSSSRSSHEHYLDDNITPCHQERLNHHVIEVEECLTPGATNQNIQGSLTNNIDECYCNCHLKSFQNGTECVSNNASVSTTFISSGDSIATSQATSSFSVITIADQPDQSQSAIVTIDQSRTAVFTVGSEQSSQCESSTTNVNQLETPTTIVGQSETTTTNVNNGIDNLAFELTRVNTSCSSASIKPPMYSGEFYLHDEPPKYEDATGLKLENQLALPTIPNTQSQLHNVSTQLSYKSRIAGAFIFVGVILVIGLLVYLSVSNEKGENSGNVRRT